VVHPNLCVSLFFLKAFTEKPKAERSLRRTNASRRTRDGLNPTPSEPQSDNIGCHGLPCVAESAYLSGFLCWWLPTVAACCALSGVSTL